MAVTDTQFTALMTSINDLTHSVGRLEGGVSTFITQMKAQDDRTTNLEVRTRKVENRQYWFAGAGTIIGAFVNRYLPHIPLA
jgi:hypothetical protein